MAVAYDNASSSQVTGAAGLSFSHTASGSDRAVFVGIGNSGTTGQLVTSVTYGGTGMTEKWDTVQQTYLGDAGYTLVAPATGSQTVAISLAGNSDEIVGGAISATSVDQTTPFGTAATPTTGASQAASVDVSAATGDLVVDFCYSGFNGHTEGANQTERWTQSVGTSVTGSSSTEAGAATVTMSQNRTGAGFSDIWITGGIAFKAAAGGGGRTTRNTRSWNLGENVGMGHQIPA